MTKITKEITIGGKKYPVVFTLQTIINFEEVANKSYFGLTELKTLDRVAIIYGAITAANPESKVKIADITGKLDLQAIKDIQAAYAVVNELAAEFFEVPEVMKPKEGEEKPQEDPGEEKN